MYIVSYLIFNFLKYVTSVLKEQIWLTHILQLKQKQKQIRKQHRFWNDGNIMLIRIRKWTHNLRTYYTGMYITLLYI